MQRPALGADWRSQKVVRVLTRLLVVFMALRVLAPPGVCLCELTQPVERLLADAFGGPRPPAHCDEEDPLFGCTLCQLPPGVEAKHVPAPPPPSAASEPLAPLASASSPAHDSSLDSSLPTLPPAGRALYISHCAIVI
jgi:hypothetical protein